MENLNQNPSSSESDNQPLNLPTTSPDTAQLSHQNNVTNPTEPQVINPQGNTGQPQPTVYGVPPNPVVTNSSQPNPTKSKKGIIYTVITVVVVILIALALYLFVFHKSSKTPSTNTNTTKSVTSTSTSTQSQASNNSTCTTTSSDPTLTCQKVVTVVDVLTPNSPSLTYYVLFYKDATLKTYNGATSQLLSNSGQAQIAIGGTNNVNDANPNPTKGCSGEPTFPFTYKGAAETGCYDLATSQTPNNNQYYGTITVGSEYYGVSMVAANPISLSTVETIFNSINIK